MHLSNWVADPNHLSACLQINLRLDKTTRRLRRVADKLAAGYEGRRVDVDVHCGVGVVLHLISLN